MLIVTLFIVYFISSLVIASAQWQQCVDPVVGFDKAKNVEYFPTSIPYFSDYSKTITNFQSHKYYVTLEVLSKPSVMVKVLLVRCGTEDPTVSNPDSFADYIKVETPVKDMGLTETLMVGLLDKGLGKLATVSAYLNKADLLLPKEPLLQARLPQIKTWQCTATSTEAECKKEPGCSFSSGKCTGAFGGPNNATKLNELDLSAVMVSAGSVESYKAVTKTPILPFSDRYEASPLGRLTWILFMGLLTDTYSTAASHFVSTRSSYMQASALAARASYKPSVWMGSAFQGKVWYFPKPDSYVARMMEDAHVYYMFSEENTKELSKNIQTIAASGQINNSVVALEGPSNTAIYAQGAEYYIPRAGLNENKVSEVVALNTAVDIKTWRAIRCGGGLIDYNKGGFPNPVFYDGILNPDLLLKDVIYLTHPDLRGALDYETVYYMAYEQDLPDLTCPVPARIPVVPPRNGKTTVVSNYKISGIRRQLIDIGLYEASGPGKVSLYEMLKSKFGSEELNLGFVSKIESGRRRLEENADDDELVLKVVAVMAVGEASNGIGYAENDAANSITEWLKGQSDEGGSPRAVLDGEPLVYRRGAEAQTGKEGLSSGAVAGITLASVAVFLLIIFIAYLIYRRYRKKGEEEERLRRSSGEGDHADVEDPSVGEAEGIVVETPQAPSGRPT